MASPTDPRYSRQDVIRCTLCELPVAAPMYCEVCHIDLCKDCVEKHLADKSKLHQVVSLKQYLSTLRNPKCSDHPDNQCKRYCINCDCAICSHCERLKKHTQHDFVDLWEHYKAKGKVLRRDLQELEQRIYPELTNAASEVPYQKVEQRKNSRKIKTDLKKHGKALHTEIDIIIKKMEIEVDNSDTQYLAALDKHKDAINDNIKQILQIIQDLKNLLKSDVCLVSGYKSRIEEFRKLSPKLKVTLPKFNPVRINRKHVLKQFGSLTALSVETEEQGSSVLSPGAESSPKVRLLLDVPRLIADIPTGYKPLYNVSCLNDEEIWTSGDNEILKLYNLQAEVLNTVQTKSGKVPEDIAVTRSGDLVYADYRNRSINLVSGTQIHKLITLRGWIPFGLCSTSSGDLLVIMRSDDNDSDRPNDRNDDDDDDDDDKQIKVLRYTDSTEKQSIQWDHKGKPLFASGGLLSENRNFDICVADCASGAVVVVSAAGKLRFRYTGPPSTVPEPFHPRGITTDSRANILISDWDNHSIHIIDQDGLFLRYINNCGLHRPYGLSVNPRDNLFVAEFDTGKVKKIQYYKKTHRVFKSGV